MIASSAPRTGAKVLAGARVLVGALVLAAIGATWAEAASRTTINPWDFFGYFTIQSNLLCVATALVCGVAAVRHRGTHPIWLVQLRGLTTVCMIVVGLVYAVLLAPLGAAGGVPVPWANWVMHIAAPLLVTADWLCTRDRGPLPWSSMILQLGYPLIWTTVVLMRGATDGWVPYPFLNPSQGYGTVAVAVVGIAIAFSVVSVAVIWWSRRPVRSPRSPRAAQSGW
ncbi:hypothetical protein GCM10009847_18260 [Leucobacter tardus]|uniref:Pr6Pr family membrane protein n=1 Tax=Leucobacter tardus TaxID=501483 RepID=A0A939QEY7_9MICO|nr:Pr6Pr family membrane protein [Leucobacter tardus]MBO2990661.1 Pr6Pr family membrane protein [Leucobacter tardus]